MKTDQKQDIGINPQNGEILFVQNTDDSYMVVKNGQIKLSNVGKGVFTAINEPTGQYLWQKPQYWVAEFYPTVLDNGHVLTQFGPAIYFIDCIDIKTGHEYWKTERNIVSNYAVIGKQLFALQENGVLAAFDVNNGQYLGGMEFDRGIKDPGEAQFWVATLSSYLLIYFGDSQELIAFQAVK